ncbi:TPA: hypothetical protein HA324_03585 [Candidatus Thalassarchaeaceae archaeon]|nr:MAG TPA: hypothetical protein D7I14_03555 [Candidatus Poseidoniales archaeon]HII42233.1 hypothetical protein [Candidatus Thalassarchaeaceae archaeon]
MHIATKITLGIGSLVTIVSIFGLVIGGSMLDSMDPNDESWAGELMMKDQASLDYEDNFEWTSIYNVFVEEGYEVDVEVLNGGDNAYFESCDIWGDCDYYDNEGYQEGFQYIGEIIVDQSGTYEINFIVNGDGEEPTVMIREESITGVFGILGGFFGCCLGIIILSIGLIFALVLKDKKTLPPNKVMIVGREESITPLIDIQKDDNNDIPQEIEDDSNPDWWK